MGKEEFRLSTLHKIAVLPLNNASWIMAGFSSIANTFTSRQNNINFNTSTFLLNNKFHGFFVNCIILNLLKTSQMFRVIFTWNFEMFSLSSLYFLHKLFVDTPYGFSLKMRKFCTNFYFNFILLALIINYSKLCQSHCRLYMNFLSCCTWPNWVDIYYIPRIE